MAKYRTKPVIIEAEEFIIQGPLLRQDDLPADMSSVAVDELGNEIRFMYWPVMIGEDNKPYLVIPTLEGFMRAGHGDFIIQGPAGEFYPCKPHIFHQKYEKADE